MKMKGQGDMIQAHPGDPGYCCYIQQALLYWRHGTLNRNLFKSQSINKTVENGKVQKANRLS
jgi:hypothetical protein